MTEPASDILSFKDFGFKLAVINQLMYEEGIITPQFEVGAYIEKQRFLKKGEGAQLLDDQYMLGKEKIIPEAKEYFENLKISKSMVQDITELFSDGGDRIYHEIFPFWSGEDDIFDVKSATDIKFFPKLKKARLLFKYPGEELKKEFRKFGVELYF